VSVALLPAILLVAGFLAFTAMIERRESRLPVRADGIVALTGGEARIDEAVKLLSEGAGRRLFISGVHERTTRNALQRKTPGFDKLFSCCIDLGRSARDTIGNAQETREWVEGRGFRSIIIVTSSYHMPRSLIELRRAMPDVELIAYPVVSSGFHIERWWMHPQSARLLVSEYVKLIPAAARLVTSRIVGEARPTGTALADPMGTPRL
jgi:uncharacterized SAM-binding protein YcdF (DUF218 family)